MGDLEDVVYLLARSSVSGCSSQTGDPPPPGWCPFCLLPVNGSPTSQGTLIKMIEVLLRHSRGLPRNA